MLQLERRGGFEGMMSALDTARWGKRFAHAWFAKAWSTKVEIVGIMWCSHTLGGHMSF